MDLDSAILELQTWRELVILILIGFLLGLTTNIPAGARYFTVALAQSPFQIPKIRVPLLPRCLFGGLLVALIGGHSLDPDFRSTHQVFVTALLACLVSIGVWFWQASRFQLAVEGRKEEEIKKFLADGAVVHAPAASSDVSPVLRLWDRLNILAFVLLTTRAAIPVLLFYWRSHHTVTS